MNRNRITMTTMMTKNLMVKTLMKMMTGMQEAKIKPLRTGAGLIDGRHTGVGAGRALFNVPILQNSFAPYCCVAINNAVSILQYSNPMCQC